jgi:hypothetical protein
MAGGADWREAQRQQKRSMEAIAYIGIYISGGARSEVVQIRHKIHRHAFGVVMHHPSHACSSQWRDGLAGESGSWGIRVMKREVLVMCWRGMMGDGEFLDRAKPAWSKRRWTRDDRFPSAAKPHTSS